MRRILTVVTMLALLASASATLACYYGSMEVTRALAENPEVRAKAIAQLRDAGPAGLEDIVAQRAMRKEQLADAMSRGDSEHADRLQAQIVKLDALLDEVGGAKYCSVSQLYWFTDFDKAKAEATRTNKPILCLRMMGKLNEEFSCANSRFFRTTLYSNEAISKTLRERFVLHWQSVRPVPRVTIDFGDGRKLERTLTGNSIHYVVDKDGRPLDGLPGLYGPQAFQQWLTRAEHLASVYAAADVGSREELLADYHRQRLAATSKAFAEDLAKVAVVQELNARPNGPNLQAAPQAAAPPPAKEAAKLAETKRRAEIRIVREVATERDLPAKMEEVEDSVWEQIAALHAEDAKLDAASVALIRAEAPDAVMAGRRAFGKAIAEDPLARLVRRFQASIAVDTVRNEYVLHRQLHQWFVDGQVEREVHPLNERVYAELFLTPSSDPWLGLMTPDSYAALRNNGVSVEVKTEE